MHFEGKKLRISVFGQSHAPAVGAVMEGIPAGMRIDMDRLQSFLARRAPGQGRFTTARKETDMPEFLSGITDGKTCGAPVCIVIRNRDTKSADYDEFRRVPRPGHADWPALVRDGGNHDIRGGGQFSARLTAPVCAAGGIALQLLEERGIRIGAHAAAIGTQVDDRFDPVRVSAADFDRILANGFPTLSEKAGNEMLEEIEKAREEQDSLGGTVEVAATGLPVGIGDALFGGLESALGAAYFGIPAVKGVEFGDGFFAALMRGSQHNDAYTVQNGKVTPRTNHAGGLLGGMTTGMPLIARIAFKPTPSIAREQQSVDLEKMEETRLTIRGRHDPCVVPRAVPVTEAVTALVLLDRLL